MPEVAGSGLRHMVLLYGDRSEYLSAVGDFVRAGLSRGEPVLMAVPSGSMLPDWLSSPGQVTVLPMTELGRNPARVIPAIREFADKHVGRPVRIISEWVWPGRSSAEMCEGVRHEALVDRALADVPAVIACPYDVVALPSRTLADAAHTHRWQLGMAAIRASAAYAGPDAMPASCRLALPNPPADAEEIRYVSDLRPVRAMVTSAARRAGLAASKVTDLMIAVSEVAANTLRHTKAGGTAYAWQCDGEVLCQVSDTGYITDPLAGLRHPPTGEPGGQGLWVVNQVCDLVELRSSEAGTQVRLHMRIPA